MKICVAQTKPVKGAIETNIAIHQQLIALAIANSADCIIFPELSLTGYEPTLAKALAIDKTDDRLTVFQTTSNNKNITIGIGAPTKSNKGILISLLLFQPAQEVTIYSKQHLHTDELPYFVNGNEQVFLSSGITKTALAICYESLLETHAANAAASGAKIYLASVAKSAGGIAKTRVHYPAIAKKYGLAVLLSNCTGPSDDFEAAGQSAIWNEEGLLLDQIDHGIEGILIFDTLTGETTKCLL